MATRAAGPLQKSLEGESPGERPAGARAWIAEMLEAQWRQWPLLVPVALGAGIALWFGLPLVGERRAMLVASLAVAVSGLALEGRGRLALSGAGFLVALGLVAADLRSQRVAAPVLHHRLAPAEVEGTIEAVEQRRGGERTRLVLATDRPAIRFSIALDGPPPPGIVAGARIAVPAMFEPQRGPLVPGGYDRGRRAWFEGISAAGRATGPPRLLSAPQRPLARPFDRARTEIDGYFARTLGPERGALASALVTGAQGRIAEERREAMAVAGLAHLITVSGFHVAIVAGGGFLLLRRLPLFLPMRIALRLPLRPLAAAGATLLAWAYVGLAGAEVPALRAGIMISIVMLALAIGRDPFSLRLLALAATLLLLFRPEILLTPSFQLSFAAVLSLLLLAERPWFQAWFGAVDDGLLRRFLKGLGALLVASLVVEIVLMPIALAHFGRAGTFGMLANAVAIPLTSLVLMPGLALHLAGGALGLSDLTAVPVSAGLGLLGRLADGVAALPGARIAAPLLSPLAFGLIAAGGLVGGLLVGRARAVGLMLLVGGLVVEAAAERPVVLVAGDARQLGIVREGILFVARGKGESAQARAWAEATGARAIRPLSAMAGARCSAGGCAARAAPGLDLLVLTSALPLPREALRVACARADLVVGGRIDRAACVPRWRTIEADDLLRSGALAIGADRRIRAAADRSGDHPWSIAALPGVQKRLIGRDRWVEPIAE